MLKAKGIYKKYGALPILKGIDLEIKKQEVVSIVGASGAGKTTLLQILGTLDKPDEGELIINGENVVNLKGNALAKFRNLQLGFVFQFHQLLPEFSALENVMIPALLGTKTKTEAQQKGEALLTFLGLQDRLKHKPS